MDILASFLLLAHYLLLIVLCFFGAHRIYITSRSRKHYRPPQPLQQFDELPLITVQLPLYNERYVARRLIEAAAQLNYPPQRLQIQVLDDSTDDTTTIVAASVADWRSRGIDIEHVRREQRRGYKAGALADALPAARGEFIAVFDADFLPPKDLLLRMIHYFSDASIGMVQAQWDYLNRDTNLLTRLQSIMLDAHFSIEQTGRHALGAFFNFNGTAGIWRRQAIVDGGGWQADTITEDLDLSYRAQLAGWRFHYLRDVRCPSELPADMNAFKSQQYRWTKGGIEVMRKLLPALWRAPLDRRTRFEATVHLTSNLSHLLILLDSLVFLIPSIVMRQEIIPYPPIWVDLLVFLFGGAAHLYYYLAAQASLGRDVWRQAPLVPLLMAMSIGLSRSNGTGVLEALRGQRSAFVRTPKQGDGRPALDYLRHLSTPGTRLELIMSAAYAATAVWCIANQVWLALPFMLLFTFGFAYTGSLSARAR